MKAINVLTLTHEKAPLAKLVMLGLVAGAALLAAPTQANAQVAFGLRLGQARVGVYAPAQTYYAPEPAYYAPAPPAYYAPAFGYYNRGYDRHEEWEREHRDFDRHEEWEREHRDFERRDRDDHRDWDRH